MNNKNYRIIQNGTDDMRREFCRNLTFTANANYIDQVRYVQKNRPAMTQTASGEWIESGMNYMFGLDVHNGKTTITVYPKGFESRNLAAFFSGTDIHEGQHARQEKMGKAIEYTRFSNQFNKRQLNSLPVASYLCSLMEIPAYASELVNQDFEKLVQEDKSQITSNLDHYLKSAKKFAKKLRRRDKLKSDLNRFLCDSSGDDWVRENILK